MLTQSQSENAIAAMRAYLAAPPNPDGRTPREVQSERDRGRVVLIEGELGSLLRQYLQDQLPLRTFKSQIDGINKRNSYWGFKGIKGQMFFNMILNVAPDQAECDRELKRAIKEPPDDASAREQIAVFHKYVTRIGEQFVDAGNSRHGRPKPSSVPYFRSEEHTSELKTWETETI